MRPASLLLTRIVLLVVLILLGLVLAWSLVKDHYLSEPLWLDERHSQWAASASWSELWHRAEIGNQPPLYFILLKLVGVSGSSDAWLLRLPSLLSWAALIVIVSIGLFRWTKRLSAVVVALSIVVFQPDFWFYASESRVYLLLALVSCIQIVLVAKRLGLAGLADAKRPSESTRLAALLASLLMVWLHYTAILLLVAEAIAGLIQVWIDPRRRKERWFSSAAGRDLLIDVLALGIGLLPLASSLVGVGREREAWTAFVQVDREQLEPMVHLLWWALLVPIVGVVVDRLARGRLAPVANSSDSTSAHAPSPTVPDTIGLAGFVTAATLLAWTLAALATWYGSAPLLTERYLFGTWSWIAIASGMWIATLPGSFSRPIVAVVLAATLAVSPDLTQWYYTGAKPVYRTENWQAIVERLNETAHSEDTVWLYGGIIEEQRLGQTEDKSLEEYLKFPLVGISDPERVKPMPTMPTVAWPTDAREQLQTATGISIVVRDNPWDAEMTRSLARELERTARSIRLAGKARIESYGSIRLIVFDRATDATSEGSGDSASRSDSVQ